MNRNAELTLRYSDLVSSSRAINSLNWSLPKPRKIAKPPKVNPSRLGSTEMVFSHQPGARQAGQHNKLTARATRKSKDFQREAVPPMFSQASFAISRSVLAL